MSDLQENPAHSLENHYLCVFCNEKFLDIGVFNRHMFDHTKNNPPLSSEEFSNNTDLQNHKTETPDVVKPFLCNTCGKRFSQARTLRTHCRSHTKENLFTCNICNHGFVSRASLEIHKRIHTNEKPFICNVCEKGFYKNSNLIVHLRYHMKERRFVCKFCKQKFFTKEDMKVHVRSHTNEKPFTCSFCKKGFTRSACLKIHLRTHTRETPYSCELCNKKFIHKVSIKTHLLSHANEKPFTCKFCDKGFIRRISLVNHMSLHTKETPYVCKICNKGFTRNFSLTNHLKAHEKKRNRFACEFCADKFSYKSDLEIHLLYHAAIANNPQSGEVDNPVCLESPPNLSRDLSKISKTIKLNSDLSIQELNESHTKELFSLTDRNRTYLKKWLPWLDSCTAESDTLNFISSRKNAISKNSGLTFGIFYNEKLVGTISFNQIDWLNGEADIGYWIGEEFQGLGLVTKACSKLMEIGFQELDLKKLVISCALENTKSQSIARRLGFKNSEIAPKKENLYGTYVDHTVYIIYKDEWIQMRKRN